MAKKITSKGRTWELMNSIWMLWTIATLGFFNYISFFYIAYRVKQRKWTIWGIIYAIPFIVYIISTETVSQESGLSDAAFGALMISWIGSIFHAIKVRPEYLIRLEQYKKIDNNHIDQLRQSIQKEYETEGQNSSNNDQTFKTVLKKDNQVVKNNTVQETITPVDINTSSEEEIASIPSIGAILAKKVMTIREQKGGFSSIDDFAELLQLKPHVRERIKPYVEFSKLENQVSKNSEEKSGRIVDF
ncbi:ComEA family DNA-binding protein [Metabacillus bambusae]|uniref:Helix-hairpin-helix domain-containing protein n=1 Tax=Metabacillus bambusae TaxID=2795218 RepID=A0ABS3NAV8_9BACI|nr:helix-hairpin-helix domain-containing protein [Metabacillus bambusae]MBO1515414.1 helix-hairpin-helix domain-containing protein [Metabacillus bambusae]